MTRVTTWIVCLLVAGPAYADDLVLDWEAPPGCPSGEDVRAEVATLLGHEPDTLLRARASVASDASGWHVALVTTDGERRLDASSCDEIARAVALVLALAIDREATTRDAPPRPAQPPAPGPRPAQPPAPGPRPVARGAGVRGGVGLAAVADVGTLPAPGAGVAIAVGLRPGRWRLELSGTYWLPQSAALAGRGEAGGDFQLVGGGASVCRAALQSRLEVAACGRAELGILAGTGIGVSNPATSSSPFATLLAGVTAALPLGRHVALRIDADLGWNPLRPRFDLDPYGTVHQPAAIVARARLGAETLFP